MKKKSALIGFIVVTAVFGIFLLINYKVSPQEAKGFIIALAPWMYLGVALVYLLLVTLFNLIKGIVAWSKTSPAQRLPFSKILKKHLLAIFLLALALLTFIFGRQDRGNQQPIGTPNDSWYSR